MAAIVTAINRVNEIYQRDLGVFLKLVDDNDDLIEIDGDAGFTSNSVVALFDQNQLWIDETLGNSRYDIGHVFNNQGGGLAWLGGACDDENKARGVSGISNPSGDPFYVDFVAHEIGHQLNAEHSFNGTAGSCGSARNPLTAFEPGSGSTIMSYAGICGVESLQTNADPTFHAGSIAQISRFLEGAGSCHTTISATPGNPNAPRVKSVADRIIPANTAFVLDVEASDADADALTYQWDQTDFGCPTDSSSFGQDNGSNALFRSYPPGSDSARHFPALGTQVQGLYDDAEVLPCHNRDLNFEVTVRDSLGGIDSTGNTLSVVRSGGGFQITNVITPTPGVIDVTAEQITVEWNVSGTSAAPINCANVDIEMLTFNADYSEYSVIPLNDPLSLGTPNDGSETISILPTDQTHLRTRIRVKCSDNVFYALADSDLRINGSVPAPYNSFDQTTFFNNNGTTGSIAPSCPARAVCEIEEPEEEEESSGGGGGALSASMLGWLMLLAGKRVRRRRDLRAGSTA